ncbi:hypothetical protein BDB01DRAFT_808440 [Pilobolus umbonatus]|nr:hypothetical protein BDB01DRAFT_808440 [Pilobolus umbonatus]
MTMEDNEDDEDYDEENLLDMSRPREQYKTGGLEELEKDMAEFESNLALTSGVGKLTSKMKKRLTKGELKLPPAVKVQLGEANGLYLSKQYGEAIKILQNLITDYPNAHPAWNTLGLIHYEMGSRTKALRLRMVSAHMCNDATLWKELATKSIENEAVNQAIYCLSRALMIEPNDVDMLWDRSFLFKKINKVDEAREGFEKILKLMPHHFKVINELAQIYRYQGESQRAIKLYEDAIVYHNEVLAEEDEEEEEEAEFADKLGYAEVNMLSELYLMQNDYQRCIETIKDGIRHVQERQLETWWLDRPDDDDEYFTSADQDDEYSMDHSEFPIELRTRLGICRLYLGQAQIAEKHFQYLLDYPANTYPDLQQDVAYAYFDKRYYDRALPIFQRIIDNNSELEVDLLIKTGDCYREIGDLDAAVLFYSNVLEENPDNLDVLMSLANVYEEQGKEKEALDLVDIVIKKNKEMYKNRKTGFRNNMKKLQNQQTEQPQNNELQVDGSLFIEGTQFTKAEIVRRHFMERDRVFEEKTYWAQNLHTQLKEMEPQIPANLVEADVTILRSYVRIALKLWEDFSSTPAFFPVEKKTVYRGFYEYRKRPATRGDRAALQARHMYKRLKHNQVESDGEDMDEDELLLKEEEERNAQMSEASQFRGIPFEEWYKIIIRCACMLTIIRRAEDAYEILKTATDCVIFHHDPVKKPALRVYLLACGVYSKKNPVIEKAVRWLCFNYGFRDDPYQLYSMFFNEGKPTSTSPIDDPQMKFIMRHIAAMEELTKYNTQNKGASTDVNQIIKNLDLSANVFNEERKYDRETTGHSLFNKHSHTKMDLIQHNAKLLNCCANMFSMVKNFLASLVFLLRSYSVNQKDPVVLLCLAANYIQTAMQRKAYNRHEQILQGMMFLQEYGNLVGECQEREYNFGRLYHLLGLTHLAVNHYEKVLCLPSKAKQGIEEPTSIDDIYVLDDDMDDDMDVDDEEDDPTDLKKEAAFNLYQLYMTSGSPGIAQILLRKYCTV